MRYLFKHILMRDAVYDIQLRRRLRQLHHRAAEAIEALHASDLAPHYADLAYHYERAGIDGKAIEYLYKAGHHAQETYAVEEAIDHYQRALTLLDEMVSSDEPSLTSSVACERRVELYEGLALMLFWRTRYAEAVEAYESMLKAASAIDDVAAQARAWNGLSDVQETQGDLYAALESVRRAEEIARAGDAQLEMITLLYGKGWMFYRLDDLEAALACGEQALALSSELGERREMGRNLNLLGAVHDTLGNHDQATHYKKRALALFRELGDREREGVMLNNLGVTARVRGDYEAAAELFRDALDIAREIGNRTMEMVFLSNLGGVQVKLGDFSTAEANLCWVVERAQATNVKFPDTYGALAEAYLGQGKTEDALTAARRAVELGQQMESGEFIGAAWRVLGKVARELPRPVLLGDQTCDPAACFAESLRVFKEIGAEAEQARTLREWAQYAMAHGDREQGSEMWQEACDLFDQLGMTLEVQRIEDFAARSGRGWGNGDEG